MHRTELPAPARERVRRQRDLGTWSSDLSVAELAAIHSTGFTPVGLVTGSAVFRVSWQMPLTCTRRTWHQPIELAAYAEALREARHRSLSRMRTEANELGGHGVVGVRIVLREFDSAGGAIEFTAVGTAVRRNGARDLAAPFLSGLDGEGFAKLLHTGLVPCGLVMGISAVHIHTSEWESMGDAEVRELSAAVASARESAMKRLTDEAQGVYADGCVGCTVQFDVWKAPCGLNPARDRVVQMIVIGTAVARFGSAPRGTSMALPLNG